MKKLRIATCSLAILFLASTVMARGTISGKVTDQEGNVLPGVEVVVAPVEDKSLRTYVLRTNKKGNYTVPADNGDYWITVSDETWGLESMNIVVLDQSREQVFDWSGKVLSGQDPNVIGVSSGYRITVDLVLADKAALKEAEGQILLARVVQALESGDKEQAGAIVRELLEVSPDDPTGLTLEAYLLAENGDLQAAETSLKHALEVNPDFPDAQFQLGVIYRDSDRKDEAVTMLTKVTDGAGPDSLKARAWIHKGEMQRDAGDLEQAIDSFSVAADLSWELSAVLASEIAALYTRIGDESKAEEWLEKSGGVAADDPSILYNIAVARFNEKDWELAADGFRKVIAVNTDFADAYRNLGYCLLNLGDSEEAVVNLKKYLELAPDAPDAAQIENLTKALAK